jgi:hypothetical protein
MGATMIAEQLCSYQYSLTTKPSRTGVKLAAKLPLVLAAAGLASRSGRSLRAHNARATEFRSLVYAS